MRLRSFRLQNFRNHPHTEISCSRDRNIFLGKNGEGKTNVLEAVSYLCLTKSFYASSDTAAVRLGQQSFEIVGLFRSDIGVEYEVRVSYDATTRSKEICINNSPVANRSTVIGMFPVVVLSPEQSGVTSGAPAERRRFIDVVVSQSNRSYLDNLMDYRKILRQRNRILFEAKMHTQEDRDLLEPWSEGLIKLGAQIVHKRAEFVRTFLPFLTKAHKTITGFDETPTMTYEAGIRPESFDDVEEIEKQLRNELDRRYQEDRKTGNTSTGPHKDELRYEAGGLDLKNYASQGQHKTFLVALKVAEFFYLKERCGETPLLLLDDVFSELDENRSFNLLSITPGLGQTFITTTDERRFLALDQGTADETTFFVNQGNVSYVG
jgi:DNA replication and repair protein RecF